MDDITAILKHVKAGDKAGLQQIFARLHTELRALARSRIYSSPEQTMTATALVHELYIKLAGSEKLDLNSRQHFFACAGMVMRHILVDAARKRSTDKRGGDLIFVTLGDEGMAQSDDELLALDEAMGELEQIEPELNELVHLRFFAGLTMEEIADIQQRSERTVYRDWSVAKAFLNARLAQ
jgi:RNA polymerase sigma factor (TIGR02999 family)